MRSFGTVIVAGLLALYLGACDSKKPSTECRSAVDCPSDQVYFCLDGRCIALTDNDTVDEDLVDEPAEDIDHPALPEKDTLPDLPVDVSDGPEIDILDSDIPDNDTMPDTAVDDAAGPDNDTAITDTADVSFPDGTVDDDPLQDDQPDPLPVEADELIPDEDMPLYELPSPETEGLLSSDDDAPCDDNIDCTQDVVIDGVCRHLARHYLCGQAELCSVDEGCRDADHWFCRDCSKGPTGCGHLSEICARILGEPMCLLPCYSKAECPNGFSCNDLYDENDVFLGRGCTPDDYRCCLNFDGDIAGIGDECSLHDCDETSSLIYPGAMERCNEHDDNCDGVIDEGNPGGGDSCQTGFLGICRPGVQTCIAGAVICLPVNEAEEEQCNNLDDNCNGVIDDPWDRWTGCAGPCLFDECVAGEGVCKAYGRYGCSLDHSGVECTAQLRPADEPGGIDEQGDRDETLCDYLDSDCDGVVDEGFRDPVSGKYHHNTTCGNCQTDCTAIYARQNAYGRCDAVAQPFCVMVCQRTADGYANDAYDLNQIPDDGCEFLLDLSGVYVSVQDGDDLDPDCGLGPIGTGMDNIPCASIAKGIERAVVLGRTRVLIADGLYEETVAVTDGISILGAYRADTWERHIASSLTILRGVDADPSHFPHTMTITIREITIETVIEGLVIYGENNPHAGGNSYVLYVANAPLGLFIRHITLYAGNGGPGADGVPGANGSNGSDGAGRPLDGAGYDTFSGNGRPCTDPDRTYQNGGRLTCDLDTVDGGDGGGTRCAPAGASEYSGNDGVAGLGVGAGVGGDAGDDGTINTAGLCTLPGSPMTGGDGQNGSGGPSGGGGSGCAGGVGMIAEGQWVGHPGSSGEEGLNGSGGGGGGAGGGGDSNVDGTNDRVGGVGGGGGSGACGGDSGAGGGAGGGSFGIFLRKSSVPTIEDTAIIQGLGGDGGDGGSGGSGGVGGSGGGGGICSDNCWCYQRGGKGGEGGDGGHGGGGGGGCGGVSYGIFAVDGVAFPDYENGHDNTFSGGGSGNGGAGGISLGNNGTPGAVGASGTVYLP